MKYLAYWTERVILFRNCNCITVTVTVFLDINISNQLKKTDFEYSILFFEYFLIPSRGKKPHGVILNRTEITKDPEKKTKATSNEFPSN